MFYPLAAPSWDEAEREAAIAVINSGQYTMGEQVRAFEAEFAAYFGVRHAIMVNSGSSANLIAVAALAHARRRPLQRGDEVIVPALSWATTYHPLQQYGLKLRFVDIDPETLNIDLAQLAAALTPATKAVVAVSILGNPAPLEEIRAFCDRHGLWLMEDNCESLDAELGGRKTGTFGAVNSFSFFFSHHISTMEGGMVLTDDRELGDLCRSLRAHGWTRDLARDTPLATPGASAYDEAFRFILPGYNVRPLEIEAAIGRAQLRKLPGFTAQRRRNLALFQSLFAGDARFILQREHGKSSAFAFTIILDPARNPDRARIFAALEAGGIGFRPIISGNFLRQEVMKYYDYEVVGGAVPNCDLAHDFGFYVGNHPVDLTPQLHRLRDILDTAFG